MRLRRRTCGVAVGIAKECVKQSAKGVLTIEELVITPATSRHNKIHEFQHGKASGAYVFVVTVQTAAVSVIPTAATRVYLMEPCLDPSMEVQAAGRIHRLGQTKDVLVKALLKAHKKDGMEDLWEAGLKEELEGLLPRGVAAPWVTPPTKNTHVGFSR